MKLFAATAFVLLSSSAFAHTGHHHTSHAANEVKLIEQMTCSEAIAFGKKNGYIMTRGAGNDAPVPVFPISPEPYTGTCGKGQYLKPWFLPALDTEACVINWVCV